MFCHAIDGCPAPGGAEASDSQWQDAFRGDQIAAGPARVQMFSLIFHILKE